MFDSFSLLPAFGKKGDNYLSPLELNHQLRSLTKRLWVRITLGASREIICTHYQGSYVYPDFFFRTFPSGTSLWKRIYHCDATFLSQPPVDSDFTLVTSWYASPASCQQWFYSKCRNVRCIPALFITLHYLICSSDLDQANWHLASVTSHSVHCQTFPHMALYFLHTWTPPAGNKEFSFIIVAMTSIQISLFVM